MAEKWLLSDELDPIKLDKSQLLIGRDEGDVTLPHKTVSRRHAVLKEVGQDRYIICDLASSNGTFVNGKKITRYILKLGDEIQIGSYKFRFSKSSTRFSEKTDFFTASKRFSLVGQLDKTSLVEVLQSIEFHKKTGMLLIQHEKYGKGKLIFGNGRPIAANFRALNGTQAILEMLCLKEGYFMTTNDTEPHEAGVDESFTNILLTYLKFVDEASEVRSSSSFATRSIPKRRKLTDSESTWFD